MKKSPFSGDPVIEMVAAAMPQPSQAPLESPQLESPVLHQEEASSTSVVREKKLKSSRR